MRHDDAAPASTAPPLPGSDRRSRLRIDVLDQIDAHSAWRPSPLRLREMSEAGFSVESTTPFELNAVHTFRIKIEGSGPSVILPARARHCTLATESGPLVLYLAGFELASPSERTLEEVRSLLRFAESMWTEGS